MNRNYPTQRIEELSKIGPFDYLMKRYPGSAEGILLEHGIAIVKVDGQRYLEKDGKQVLRPSKPKDCYQLLIDEFGITEPRLVDFR